MLYFTLCIRRQFPDYKAYEIPSLFQSDWLNEFWDQWTDMNYDYRFVYMGPQGTWYVAITKPGAIFLTENRTQSRFYDILTRQTGATEKK
jgi:hypothetical protein